MKKFLATLLLLFCFSCTTIKYIEVPIEKIKTEYITLFKTDTLIQKDSIDRYIKGDTVYNYKYKYIYRTSIVRDTCIVRDTIPTIVEKEVEKKVNVLYSWQKLFIGFGFIFVFGIIYLLYKTIKKRI